MKEAVVSGCPTEIQTIDLPSTYNYAATELISLYWVYPWLSMFNNYQYLDFITSSGRMTDDLERLLKEATMA